MKRPFLITICVLASACHHKKKQEEAFFPVSNFLKGDAAAAARSGNSFRKIVSGSGKTDTVLINKAAFENLAEAFTRLPDISSDELNGDYEEAKMYDDQLQSVILTYTATKANLPVRREDVMLQPDEKGDTHVKTIIVDWLKDEKDSTVEKNMVWEAGKNFFIVTKVNKQGQPEKIDKLGVTWDGFSNQSSSQSTDK